MTERAVVVAAGGTVTGRRGQSQDAFLADRPVFIVADGMGGHAEGGAASTAVVDAFRPLVDAIDLAPAAVEAALAHGSIAVERIAVSAGALAGATATGIALVSSGGSEHWLVFNIGDSRTYRYANGRLAQLTVDHSVVQELVESGSISREAARDHPEANVITRSVSPGGGAPDLWLLPVTSGERLLICSDGVTKELTDADLTGLLERGGSPAAVVAEVLERVAEAGARDDATVVVVDVQHGDDRGADDTVPRARLHEDDPDITVPHQPTGRPL